MLDEDGGSAGSKDRPDEALARVRSAELGLPHEEPRGGFELFLVEVV